MSLSKDKQENIVKQYQKLPFAYIPNKGQVENDEIAFYTQKSNFSVGFSKDRVILTWISTQEETENTTDGLTLAYRFLQRNPDVSIFPLKKQEGHMSYFYGKNFISWITEVPSYEELMYSQLWPHIDLVFRGDSQTFKYDFIVHPGGSAKAIAWKIEGADHASLDGEGNLLISTPYGIITEEKPLTYQEIHGKKKYIKSNFVLYGENTVGISVSEEYDLQFPLIIDPNVLYSTYLGGSSVDQGLSIAIDDARNAYVTGLTASNNFPTTPGAFQTTFQGFSDAFVTKLNAAGTALLYSTYLGGSGVDQGLSIAIDDARNAYVTGLTDSDDFPTTPSAFQTTSQGIVNAFVTKLNAAGTELLYSTYLSGSSNDQGQGIAINTAGNAYVTGFTQSNNFPTTPGAFQTTRQGNLDAFVTKLNAAGTALLYSTYLGGSSGDQGLSIAIDIAGNAYVTGRTQSNDFPTTPDAFQTTRQGNFDAFVTKLNFTGTALLYSTYLGGSSGDQGLSIAIDDAENAYVTGNTLSNDFLPLLALFKPRFKELVMRL